jgi:hypothetical protein
MALSLSLSLFLWTETLEEDEEMAVLRSRNFSIGRNWFFFSNLDRAYSLAWPYCATKKERATALTVMPR